MRNFVKKPINVETMRFMTLPVRCTRNVRYENMVYTNQDHYINKCSLQFRGIVFTHLGAEAQASTRKNHSPSLIEKKTQ